MDAGLTEELSKFRKLRQRRRHVYPGLTAASYHVLHGYHVDTKPRPVHGAEDFHFRSLDVQRQVVDVGDVERRHDGVERETVDGDFRFHSGGEASDVRRGHHVGDTADHVGRLQLLSGRPSLGGQARPQHVRPSVGVEQGSVEARVRFDQEAVPAAFQLEEQRVGVSLAVRCAALDEKSAETRREKIVNDCRLAELRRVGPVWSRDLAWS